ncbi:MAG: 30S ribosomal protein S2 [Kiritimatiellae bacterium]|nr:30S ribosomal protein S2 [Kiritimatiellia bacterium]
MDTTAPAPRVPVDLKTLLEAGVHFGHRTRRWNPKMKPFIFGERNGIYVIDLGQTLERLAAAREFLRQTVRSGRQVLMVGTKKQAQELVRQAAESLKMPYVVNRWLGGMLTNNRTIRQSVVRMRKLEEMAASGALDTMPKKEAASARHELAKLQKSLSGVANMEQLPGAVLVVDVCRDAIAVAEANRLGIPVVALVDTNADPDLVQYPIPANDDAIRSIQVILNDLVAAMREGLEEFEREEEERRRQRAAEEAEERARQEAAEKMRRQREREERRRREEALAKAKAAEVETLPAPDSSAPLAPMVDSAPEVDLPGRLLKEVKDDE